MYSFSTVFTLVVGIEIEAGLDRTFNEAYYRQQKDSNVSWRS